MALDQTINDVPNIAFSYIEKVTSVVNGILVGFVGQVLAVYVILIIALILAWFLREAIMKKGNNYLYYGILALLIFLSLRYLGFGG